MSETLSVQERYAPRGTCFGCGPVNPEGLHIQSHEHEGEGLVAAWTPRPCHEAYEGFLSGGITGALLDCHSNWTAAVHLMRRAGTEHPPCTVTARYSVKLLRPTPTREGPLRLASRVVDCSDDRAEIESTLTVGEEDCAVFRGTFVAVKPGHPAYHRW